MLALILGGRSWVGYRLSLALAAKGCGSLCATAAATLPAPLDRDGASIRFAHTDSPQSITALMRQQRPDIVINLLIGTTERDFNCHLAAADAAAELDALFVYGSSALALEAYTRRPVLERTCEYEPCPRRDQRESDDMHPATLSLPSTSLPFAERRREPTPGEPGDPHERFSGFGWCSARTGT